jgi:hypothetical protein
VEIFIKAAIHRDKRKQNSELFFRQTHEISGSLSQNYSIAKIASKVVSTLVIVLITLGFFFNVMTTIVLVQCCFQCLVFNSKLGLSTAIKCNSVFRMCVNDLFLYKIPLYLKIFENTAAPALSSQNRPSR